MEPTNTESVEMTAILINDKRCVQCDTSNLKTQLASTFPGIEFKELDYSDKEGKELYIKSLQEKYGENITSPWNLLKVKKKISEQLIDYYKENEHHTSGKSYNEMYGETKSNKLITQRRESGAKSYRELLNSGYVASEQQIELFNIVKEIFPSAKLEYEQHCYFIDIAIPEYKIAIEFDGSDFFHGNSHDEKRDKLLKQFGWDTIRFKNKVPNINEVKIEIMKIRPHLFSFTG